MPLIRRLKIFRRMPLVIIYNLLQKILHRNNLTTQWVACTKSSKNSSLDLDICSLIIKMDYYWKQYSFHSVRILVRIRSQDRNPKLKSNSGTSGRKNFKAINCVSLAISSSNQLMYSYSPYICLVANYQKSPRITHQEIFTGSNLTLVPAPTGSSRTI